MIQCDMRYIYDVNFDDTLVYPRSLEEHVNYKDKRLRNHGILMVKVIWRNCDLEKAT